MVVTRNVAGLDVPRGVDGQVLGVGSIEEGLRRLRETYPTRSGDVNEEAEPQTEEQQRQGRDGYVGGERRSEETESVQLGRVFVIGGAEIYRHALEMECCERILWTRLGGEWDCDVSFPEGVLLIEDEGDDARIEGVGEHETRKKWVRRSTEELERWVGEEGVGGVKREGEVEFEVSMLEREGVRESGEIRPNGTYDYEIE